MTRIQRREIPFNSLTISVSTYNAINIHFRRVNPARASFIIYVNKANQCVQSVYSFSRVIKLHFIYNPFSHYQPSVSRGGRRCSATVAVVEWIGFIHVCLICVVCVWVCDYYCVFVLLGLFTAVVLFAFGPMWWWLVVKVLRFEIYLCVCVWISWVVVELKVFWVVLEFTECGNEWNFWV